MLQSECDFATRRSSWDERNVVLVWYGIGVVWRPEELKGMREGKEGEEKREQEPKGKELEPSQRRVVPRRSAGRCGGGSSSSR